MNRLAQEAVIVGLARRLYTNGSWTGETHIQKAAYLLHGLTGVPFQFDFILYKHGPFSFELRDELTSMRADRLIDREVQPPPYGPRILPTDRGQELEARFSKTMSRYARQLDWVASELGDRGVMDLERLATALWVTRHLGENASVDERAEELNKHKPHVSISAAAEAVREVDQLIEASRELAVA
jgi:uncharacterized protein YwgA